MHRSTHHAPAHHLGIREAARQLGFVHTTISHYVRRFPELNRGSKGRPKVDLDELRRHRAANINPSRIGSHAGRLLGEGQVEVPPAAGPVGDAPPAATMAPPPNYAHAKAVRETVLAKRARVDLDEKCRLLVPRAEVEAAVYDAGAVLLRDLLGVGPQLAERIAAMDDPKEIAALMEAEYRKVLAALAASLRAKAAEEAKARPAAEVTLPHESGTA